MRIFAIVISVLILMGLDMSSKYFVEQKLFGSWQSLCEYSNTQSIVTEYCTMKRIPVVGEYLGIELSYNQGVAFSLPITGLPLKILTILIIIALIVYYVRIEYPKKNMWIDTAFVFIIAGALSHAYERIFVGHVVDFIAVKYFAILNFADIFISIGAIILIIVSLISSRKN